ncbi:MAG: methyl-accepting chemotaxis protein [Pseudolabrys sp.]|nr:methyl-accepting chemotaxis protein [Pseudolabrys sp.]
MRPRSIGISTKLNVVVAIPIILALAIAGAAGIGIARVADYAKRGAVSGKILHDATEFSRAVERTKHVIKQPGSQQQVETRLKPETARLRALADILAASMQDGDQAMVQGFTDGVRRLEQVVLEAMLARGGMTEAISLFPSTLASFAKAASALSIKLRMVPVAEAEAKSEALIQRSGELLNLVGSFALNPDSERFEKTRQAISNFGDFGGEVAAVLKAGGQTAPKPTRQLERERSKLYGLVTQVGGSSSRLNTVQIRIQNILDHSSTTAQRLLLENQQQTRENLAQIALWTEFMVAGAMLAFAVGVLLAIGIYLFTRRAIVLPLSHLQYVMKEISNGNTGVDVRGIDRADAIGTMAQALAVFRDSMVDIERMRAEKDRLDRSAVERRKAEMNDLARKFQSTIGEIIDAVSSASTELEQAAGSLTTIAEHTRHLSTAAATTSEQSSRNAQIVASAASELDSSIVEIDRHVHESSDIAAEAVQQAGSTDARIVELARASSQIGRVVNVISAVAKQTNLLALNATIEAARAGDAGKGFSVVAQEVKLLAAQTAAATGEIGSQIASMQAAIDDSVAAIKQIGGIIGRIAAIASTVRSAVHEQGRATEQIACNVQEAAVATAQVSTAIADVSRGASETDQASSAVLASARSLSGESARLKVEVERFLATVRAA